VTDLKDVLVEASEESLREIIRNAESYLGAQLTSALAANQRSISFSSLLMAALVLISGAGGSVIFGTHRDLYLAWTAFGVSFGLLLAIAVSIWSFSPKEFWFVGNSPDRWVADIEARKPLKESLAEQASHYAEMIETNNETWKRDATRLKTSVVIAWSSLALGVGSIGYHLFWQSVGH
jgi:hypothetical protein